jgi:uroporphyrinogen-III synthase
LLNTTLSSYNLTGLRILNTRPEGYHNNQLNHHITALGGQILCCPTLTIEPTSNAWLVSLSSLPAVTHAIFISPNAVLYFYRQLQWHGITWPKLILVTAVGRSTARMLQQHGIDVDSIPTTADSEHLLALDSWQNNSAKTVLLIKGEGGRTLIEDTLSSQGTTVIKIAVYKRIIPMINTQQLMIWWHKRAADIILITSQEGLHNLFTMFAAETHEWLRQLPYLVISQRLATAAAKLCIQTILICTIDTIINTLHQFKQGLIHDK